MSDATANREVQFLKGKLGALSAVIRLGHEAFAKQDLASWGAHVVNNSVLALPYNRAALADLRGGTLKVFALSGMPHVDPAGEYTLQVRDLLRSCRKIEAPTLLDAEALDKFAADPAARAAWAALMEVDKAIFVLPLRSVGLPPEMESEFLLLIELDNEDVVAMAAPVLALLRENYQESLSLLLGKRRTPLVRGVMDRRKWFRPSRLLLLLLLLFIPTAILVRVPQTVSAEFTVLPETEITAYAPFDGVIAEARVRSGDRVKKGDVILRFDVEERTFSLNAAKNEFARSTAQLELIARQAFNDPAKRGQVRLLELQRDKAKIDIEHFEWFLRQSVFLAPADGVADLGEAEKLEGKAVRAGERLFEILADGKLAAEIELDERNASVLNAVEKLALYLHTRPESPLPGKLVSISPRPLLTPRRTFCYVLRAELDDPLSANLFYGMRGIARVSGPRVSLGYYLFRHVVLWFRQL